MSDSQTKIIPAKRLEELRAESREVREIEVDVVFDDATDDEAAADPGLGATAARPIDALALDAAAAGPATTRRVWAALDASEEELESVDHLAELEEDEGDAEHEPPEDGWDEPADSVPLQLTPSKAKHSVRPMAASVAGAPPPMPALRSQAPPKKRG